MPFRHSLQSSRFEFKYIVDERCATGVRDFVRSYLEPDEFADPDQGNSYRIASLYVDNAELFLYRQTVMGAKNRFKLRIRFYDDNPDSPAFLEIKRRVTDVIFKERATVTRKEVLCLLGGVGPDQSRLVSNDGDAKADKALLNFYNLSDSLRAAATIYVSYRREAYVSPNSNSIRVSSPPDPTARSQSRARYAGGALAPLDLTSPGRQSEPARPQSPPSGGWRNTIPLLGVRVWCHKSFAFPGIPG